MRNFGNFTLPVAPEYHDLSVTVWSPSDSQATPLCLSSGILFKLVSVLLLLGNIEVRLLSLRMDLVLKRAGVCPGGLATKHHDDRRPGLLAGELEKGEKASGEQGASGKGCFFFLTF